jgi:hypothetical protein
MKGNTMTNKVTKTQINKTAVTAKECLWLVQYNLKKGADLDTLLIYTKALKVMTLKIEEELKAYKAKN